MKYLLLTCSLVIGCLQMIFAQKVVKKSIVNPAISLVQIDVNNCFKIQLETTDTDEILVEAFIDGEYTQDLELTVKEEGSTLVVNSDFSPTFVNPNDKLSAHKVVSIALKVLLPKYKNVTVFGASCNVTVAGKYENLKVSLNDGFCVLNEVSQNVEIITQSGDISVQSLEAKITANSTYGNIEENNIPMGDNHFLLSTTTGDIYFKKLE